MGREYHVAVTGCDQASGTAEAPFRTISRAAETALHGDTVIVHEGVYREWVKPQHGGYSDIDRIVYQSADREKVVIKGSERVESWELYTDTVWKTVIPNHVFGDYNPYAEILSGDWLVYPQDSFVHAGDVYLNGKSLYEAGSLEEVMHLVMRREGFNPPWTCHTEKLLHPEDSIYQWYAVVGEEVTTIYANFQEVNPNREFVEINVRKCCFYPERPGMNYITVRGFEMTQAACPWTPPTADQPGLLGTHWSKGWIIEDNIIHDAKCSGISIGKDASTGHNLSTMEHRKPGYQYQMEAVFKALQLGWSKETIGSHIIRNNVIYDCGQNGIVGHLGCVFSSITGNEIYNIAIKHEFFGYEIAGIKLHAAIDVQIAGNNIHHCTLGTWLDWQAQGARVSGNLYYNNNRDLMVEVTHGPYLVDNNIFASDYNFDNIAQGGAYVHNLCCGTMRREPVLNRSTPYHYPHTTQVAGTALVYGGDDRLYQNIFVGGAPVFTKQSIAGTAGYNGSTVSMEEYIDQLLDLGTGDVELFEKVVQPAYISGNVYWNGAPAFERETNRLISTKDPSVRIVEEEAGTYLEMEVDHGMLDVLTEIISTQKLGMVRIVEMPFECPDGNPIILSRDYLGTERKATPSAGPFEGLKTGHNRIRVW